MPFPLHANLLQNAARSHVGRPAGRVHAVQPQLLETVPQDGPYSLGCIAMSPIVPVQEIQELALSQLVGPYHEPAHANQRIC
jgi:hypothetical protein